MCSNVRVNIEQHKLTPHIVETSTAAAHGLTQHPGCIATMHCAPSAHPMHGLTHVERGKCFEWFKRVGGLHNNLALFQAALLDFFVWQDDGAIEENLILCCV